jgi:transcriptional regulator with XRE-family HTH domain
MDNNNPYGKQRTLGQTYIREWRKFRGKKVWQLAEFIGVSNGHVSRIERGEKPYSQEFLELAAEYLETDPGSLLMRNPQQPDAIWSLWEHASVGERQDIERLAQVIIAKKTG